MVSVLTERLSGAGWRSLVPPSLLAQILSRVENASAAPIVQTARIFGAAVASALCLPDNTATGELLLLITAPPLRRKGVGTALLAAVERAGADAGLTHVEATWNDSAEDPGVAGKFFASAGWRSAERSGIAMSLRAGPGGEFLGSLASRLRPCPYAFVAWTSLSAAQRDALHHTLRDYQAMAPGLDPFRLEKMADPSISYALVAADDRVVGWHLAYWPTPGRAWVLASFGLPEALGGACFLRLWQNFFGDVATVDDAGWCAWDTHVSLAPMMRFLLRREESARPQTQGRWHSSKDLVAAATP